MSYDASFCNSTPINSLHGQRKLETRSSNTPVRDFFRNRHQTPSPSQSRLQSPMISPLRAGNLSSRRYSLSDVNITPPNNRGKTSNLLNQSNSVLSSYGMNASTYLETKSPGYASRVVQYNEEREKSLPTHQPKYDSPGVFPIVHLFKKDLPILKRKPPSKVTVRMASSELSKYNTPEHNRVLLEQIVHSNSPKKSTQNNEVNTRSVLDALKEISRKRIHSNEEEYGFQEDGKRMRIDCAGTSDFRKRLRDDLSPTEGNTSVSKGNFKKICLIDELIASHSSMDGKTDETALNGTPSEPPVNRRIFEKPQRRKSIGHINENSKIPKETKLVDVETQTVQPELTTTATDPVPETIEVENKAETPPVKPRKRSPVKVFDEKPLEMLRKNRLAVLVGAQVFDNKLPSNGEKDEDQSKGTEKPLVSILSGPNKSPNKTEKHVTFSIEQTRNISSLSEIQTTSRLGVTQTSAAIVMPLVSSTVVKSPERSEAAISAIVPSSSTTHVNFSVPAPTINSSGSSTLVQTLKESDKSAVPVFSFSVPKSQLSEDSKTTTAPSSITNDKVSFNFTTAGVQNTEVSTPIFSFGNKSNNVTCSSGDLTTTTTATITSPNKVVGGFKFDLDKPTSSSNNLTSTIKVTSSVTPMFSFGNNEKNSQLTDKKSITQAFTSTNTTTTANIIPSTNSSKSFNFPFSNTSTAANTSKTATSPSFNFSNSAVPSSSETKPPFFSTTSKSSVSLLPTTASSAVLTNFTPNTTSTGFTLNTTQNSFTSNTNLNTFTPSTISNNFAAANSTSNFVPSTGFMTASSNTFTPNTGTFSFSNTSSKTPVFAFGPSNPVTTTNSTSLSSNVFSQQSKPLFGTTTSASMFTSTTTTQSTLSSFGTNTSQSNTSSISSPFSSNFKPSSTFNFGAATTTASTIPTFGTTTTNTFTSGFGNTGTQQPFGNTSSNPKPAFGQPLSTTTTNTPSFGITTPSFGTSLNTTSASNVFAAGFGDSKTTTTNAFGVTPTSNTFGTTTPSTNVFGATAPSTNVFGTTAPSANLFGTNTQSTNMFSTNTPPKNVFGTNTSTANAFGTNTSTANAFGTNTSTTSAFGTTTPNFSTSNFGQSNNFGASNAFSTPTTTQAASSTFGSTPAVSSSFGTVPAFGSSATSGFGSNASSIFGNTNNTPFGATTTSAPAFGTTNTFNQTNAFSSNFGSTPAKSESNTFGSAPFGGTNNAFGTSNAFPSNPTVTTQSGVFSFGTNNSGKSGVFSFGTSEPPKPSFNFTGGNTFGTGNTSFGSNSTPFGTTPQFNSGAPTNAPGMFNIGAGSSTPARSRVQLRPRRRT